MNQKTIKKYSSLAFKKYREKYGLFLAEGYHPVTELLKSDWDIEAIVTSNERIYDRMKSENSARQIALVKPGVINKIAEAKTPQDILAVVTIPSFEASNLILHSRIVIADGIKDPGNMGTIIRTALAFNFGAVIATSTSVDIFNPKSVRATQGALFGMEIFPHINIRFINDKLKSYHTLYALDPEGDIDIDRIKPAERSALIIGSEIEGIDKSLLNMADFRVRIPQSGGVDSLNAAMAAGIAMYRFNLGL